MNVFSLWVRLGIWGWTYFHFEFRVIIWGWTYFLFEFAKGSGDESIFTSTLLGYLGMNVWNFVFAMDIDFIRASKLSISQFWAKDLKILLISTLTYSTRFLFEFWGSLLVVCHYIQITALYYRLSSIFGDFGWSAYQEQFKNKYGKSEPGSCKEDKLYF